MTFLARLLVVWLTFACSLYFYLTFYQWHSRRGLEILAWNAGVFAFCFLVRIYQFQSDPPEPLALNRLHSLSLYPALQSAIRTVAQDLGSKAPDLVHFEVPLEFHRLSPILLDALQTNRDGEITIPMGGLSLWSVFELRCHIAQTLLRPPSPSWIFRVAGAQIQESEIIVMQAQKEGRQGLYITGQIYNAMWLQRLLFEWELLADMEADLKVAQRYGQANTQQVLHKYWFGEQFFGAYWTVLVAPALQHSVVPPIIEGFCSWYHLANEATPREPLTGDRPRETLPDDPSHWPLACIAERLHAIQSLPETVLTEDPRAAVDLLGDRNSFEARLAFGIANVHAPDIDVKPQGHEWKHISWDEYPSEVMLPDYVETLRRNNHIFVGKEIEDIPLMIRDQENFAETFIPEAGTLPGGELRTQAFRSSVSAFLVTKLAARGWSLHFSVEEGLKTSATPTAERIDTAALIEHLATSEIEAVEFLSRVKTQHQSEREL